MRTLKELFEQTERGLSPVLDSIRDRNSSAEVDENDFTEEAAGAAGVAGATKKVASKAKASTSSKSKEPAKTKAAKKEEPAAKAKEAKKPASAKPEPKKAPVAAPKKSAYAKGLDPVGYQEWEDAPVKKVKQLSSPEPVAKASVPPAEPIPPAIEPAAPVVEPKTPSVNTAPTQAVVDDAVTAAQKTPPPSSIGQQVAEVVESKPSLPPSKTFGEPVYGDDVVARIPEPVKSVEMPQTGDDVAREIVSSKANPFSALKNILPEKTLSLISKNADALAKSNLGKSILSSLANATLGQSVIIDPTENMIVTDETGKQRFKTASELAAEFAPQKKVNYNPPSSEKSNLNPLMASTKYDTVGNIVADATRPPEAPTPSSVQAAIGPSPRTISAGEPSAAVVKKQLREADLAPAIGLDAAQQVAQEEDFLQKFKAARAEEEEKLRIVNLQEALDTFLSGRAGIKPQSERYEKQRQQVYKDIEKKEGAQEEAELRDPKSPISAQWRNAAKLSGITLKGNESAYLLKQTMPFLQKHVEAEENREARLQEFKLRMADIDLRREATKKEKLTSDQNSYLERQARGFAKDKVHEALFILKDAKRAVEEYLKNPTPTASASLAYVFAKINDPGSVVRESELKLFGKAGSLYDKFRQQVSDLATGKITERKARELGGFISGKIQSAEADLKTKLQPVIEGGKRRGIDAEDAVTAVAGPEYYRQLFLNQPTSLPEATSQSQAKNPRVEEFAKKHNTDYEKAYMFLKDTGQIQ